MELLKSASSGAPATFNLCLNSFIPKTWMQNLFIYFTLTAWFTISPILQVQKWKWIAIYPLVRWDLNLRLLIQTHYSAY